MALTIGHHHGMTVAEFERYCDDHPDERVELINGEIYDVPPESEDHASTAELIAARLRDRHSEPMRVRTVGSVRLDDGSLWNPDVYVYEPDPARVDKYPHASEIVLVVEVMLSTADRDLGAKLVAYARNQIPEYWAIDPSAGGVFHRFTHPHLGGYRSVRSTPLPGGLDSLPV